MVFYLQIFQFDTRIMRNTIYLLLFSMAFLLTGCEVIGGIFEAGFYAGIIVVVGVIALIIYILYRVFKR